MEDDEGHDYHPNDTAEDRINNALVYENVAKKNLTHLYHWKQLCVLMAAQRATYLEETSGHAIMDSILSLVPEIMFYSDEVHYRDPDSSCLNDPERTFQPDFPNFCPYP